MTTTTVHPSDTNYQFVLSDDGQCPKCGFHHAGAFLPQVKYLSSAFLEGAAQWTEGLMVSCLRCGYSRTIATDDAVTP